MNWQSLLSSLGLGNINLGQTALGAGLFGLGAATDQVPGYVQDATQSLRNFATSQPNVFAPGGQYALLQPQLKQQESDILNALNTRIKAAFPANVGMQGPEVDALTRASGYFDQNRGALASTLMGQSMDRSVTAADDLLRYGGTQKNAMADALSRLGVATAYGGLNPQGGTGGGSIDALLQSLGLGKQQTGAPGIPGTGGGRPGTGTAAPGVSQLAQIAQQLVQTANQTGDTQGLEALLFSGQLAGVPFPFATQASTPAGQIIQQAITRGLTESPAATTVGGVAGVGSAAGAGGAVASTLASVLGDLGIAALGGYTGYKIGGSKFAPNEAVGALEGGAAGAAEGTLLLPGIGTAIGAIAGTIGGFLGKRNELIQAKSIARQEDLTSQSGQINDIGTFLSQAIDSSGGDSSGFQGFVKQQLGIYEQGATDYSYGGITGTADQQEAVSRVGGQLLLQQLQKTTPGLTSLTQVPGLRAKMIDYYTHTMVSAGDSSYSGGAPTDLITREADTAGV